jgi:acetylornithine deacetylase
LSKEFSSNQISDHVEIEKHRIIDLTRKLINFKTENPVSGVVPRNKGVLQEEIDCLQVLADDMKALGFTIDQWKLKTGHSVLVASLTDSDGDKSLLLNGHIDTVPAGKLENWHFDPWKGQMVNGRIYGLGSVDMKGNIAAFISAINIALKMKSDIKGTLLVEIVSDEEMAGNGTRECLKKGYTADAAIFAESTNLNIAICEPGLIHLRIEVFGRTAHSSTRYQSIHAGGKGYGVNAIEKAITIIEGIRKLERQWANTKTYAPLPPGLNYIHPGIIIGGPGGGEDGQLFHSPENPGTFPDYCSIEYELKFYPDEDIEEIKKEFEHYIQCICQLDSWLNAHPPKITWEIRDIYFPPAQIPRSHQLVQTVSEIHESHGREPKILGYEAVSDMCWYSSQNIPSIIYGSGEIHLAHSTNESLLIEDLLYATKVYAGTILQWCC